MFEIISLRDRLNFSCSISSKNYILIYQNFHFSITSFLKRKSGAKINTYFECTKYFGNFFQKYFSEPLLDAHRRFKGESGCKDMARFLKNQIFSNIFSSTFTPLQCIKLNIYILRTKIFSKLIRLTRSKVEFDTGDTVIDNYIPIYIIEISRLWCYFFKQHKALAGKKPKFVRAVQIWCWQKKSPMDSSLTYSPWALTFWDR